MARLVVTAAGSPLFNDFLIVVSVSAEATGQPTKGLNTQNFKIADLASLNHAAAHPRTIDTVTEGPDGFYIVGLQKESQLPPGHYVLGVAVASGKVVRGQPVDRGQTVAVGDIPA